MLANYLGRKGRETCLRGVIVFSAGWDVFECSASLEKPLDRFLFNSYLTSCLQASVHRSAGASVGLTNPPTRWQNTAHKQIFHIIIFLMLNSLFTMMLCTSELTAVSDSIDLLPCRHRPVLEQCYDIDHVMKVGIVFID